MDELKPNREWIRFKELRLLEAIRREVLPTIDQLQKELMRMQYEMTMPRWESKKRKPLSKDKYRFDEDWRKS